MNRQPTIICQLLFEVGITEERVKALVAEHTSGKGIVHHFYPNRQRGRRQISFAVVELPPGSDEKIKQVKEVLEMDYQQDFVGVGVPTSSSDCDGGGCGCGPPVKIQPASGP